MKFNYSVRDQQGKTQSGTIEALDQSTALETLQGHNLIVVKLEPTEGIFFLSKNIKFFERVNKKEGFVFFRQLSILIGADIPLVQSLRTLGKQVENHYFKEVIIKVANDVNGGMAFSKALAKHPKVFSFFSVNLIKTGEVAGQLQESLVYLADHLERDYYLMTKVRGAMIYPFFILSAFLVVGVLILVMVIPSLTSILIESGQELPLSTKIVIATSGFIRSKGWVILLISLVAGYGVWRYKKTKQGKLYWDSFKLKIPIFGKIIQKAYLAQIADSLSALFKGGVSIIQSLDILGEVIDNVVFQKIIFKAKDEVKSGKSISVVLEQYDEFPSLFCQMIKTGEETGKLDDILEKLNSFYNKEIENVVDNLSQLIEPVLIIGLAIGVGILIFAVFMPIYNLAGGI